MKHSSISQCDAPSVIVPLCQSLQREESTPIIVIVMTRHLRALSPRVDTLQDPGAWLSLCRSGGVAALRASIERTSRPESSWLASSLLFQPSFLYVTTLAQATTRKTRYVRPHRTQAGRTPPRGPVLSVFPSRVTRGWPLSQMRYSSSALAPEVVLPAFPARTTHLGPPWVHPPPEKSICDNLHGTMIDSDSVATRRRNANLAKHR